MIDLSYRDIFGNLKDKQETANSYVISKPGNYCFPLIYGCGIMNGSDNKISYTRQQRLSQSDFYDYRDKIINNPEINYKGEKIRVIVWDNSREVIRDIKIVKDYIHLSISNIPEHGGNYILALFDNDEKIIWSWHIWLWDKKLENINIEDHKLLNTNLASRYDSHGKLWNWYYQWGRKDPLCYLERMINIRKCAKSVGQSIQNPNTFFTNDYYNNSNWVKIEFFYNYWNARCYKDCLEEPVDKTIYDPCPPGYTVPGYGVFYELSEDKWDDKRKGWLFKGGIFFPSSGFRYYDCGVISYCSIGNSGLYWSAGQTTSAGAGLLRFDNNTINSLYRSPRSYGYSVRPVAI